MRTVWPWSWSSPSTPCARSWTARTLGQRRPPTAGVRPSGFLPSWVPAAVSGPSPLRPSAWRTATTRSGGPPWRRSPASRKLAMRLLLPRWWSAWSTATLMCVWLRCKPCRAWPRRGTSTRSAWWPSTSSISMQRLGGPQWWHWPGWLRDRTHTPSPPCRSAWSTRGGRRGTLPCRRSPSWLRWAAAAAPSPPSSSAWGTRAAMCGVPP
mmetsp:Transcript_51180/g.160590  ORF Transcript_51180/g.160590 Transcript_51180/m.160590 type:complete len:209 (+) Transcript_51180:258-884(+)